MHEKQRKAKLRKGKMRASRKKRPDLNLHSLNKKTKTTSTVYKMALISTVKKVMTVLICYNYLLRNGEIKVAV